MLDKVKPERPSQESNFAAKHEDRLLGIPSPAPELGSRDMKSQMRNLSPSQISSIPKKLYRDIKDSSTETKIEDIRVIDDMVTKCIPPSKNGDSIYELHTKAVICYFFEFCDFGKKTKVEEKSRKTL